jgi:hypothetical protein
MTTRRRLARLERLERLASRQPGYSCPEFFIAPELARAIVDTYGRLSDLLSRHSWREIPGMEQIFGSPDPAAEDKAAAQLAELLRDIRCPPDYWKKQADTDRRLKYEEAMRPSMSGDQAAQMRARLIVFAGTPVGAVWRRMVDLSQGELTRAEQAELDELHRRYPGMPLYDPNYESDRFFSRVLRQHGHKDTVSWDDFEFALWQRVQRHR